MGMPKASYWYVSVTAVKAWRPRAADKLVFAHALQAVCIRPRDRAVHKLIQHLRQARRIKIVHQILRGHSASSFAHPVSVVDQCHTAVRRHPVLEIVPVHDVRRRRRIAVVVVGNGWVEQFGHQALRSKQGNRWIYKPNSDFLSKKVFPGPSGPTKEPQSRSSAADARMKSASHSSDVLSPSSSIDDNPSDSFSGKVFTNSFTLRPSYSCHTLSGGIVRLRRFWLGDWLLTLREAPRFSGLISTSL